MCIALFINDHRTKPVFLHEFLHTTEARIATKLIRALFLLRATHPQLITVVVLHSTLPAIGSAVHDLARESAVLLGGAVDVLLDLGEVGDVLGLQVAVVRFRTQ